MALVKAQVESVASPTAARILGNIPDGTPPPPSPPKPEFVIQKRDILDRKIHEQGGRNITIQQIKPIALPPPPPPVEPTTAVQDKEFSECLAECRATHSTHELLFLGATVFRSNDSPPRTLVRWWPQGGGDHITFWSSADFALIAGGINSFADTTGNIHSLFMGWGNVDIDRMTELHGGSGREYNVPEMPDFIARPATFGFVGKQPAEDELAVIQALHDLYNSNLAELKTAHEGRELARAQRAAYLKAHFP